MAEYGRIQKKQGSRAITNNGGGSKQLKGIVDNRIIQKRAEAIERYERMQTTHGGGKPHGKRTTVPKKRIASQREASINEIFERSRAAEERRVGTPLNAERIAQLKSKCP